jgi:hypothetical protein
MEYLVAAVLATLGIVMLLAGVNGSGMKLLDAIVPSGQAKNTAGAAGGTPAGSIPASAAIPGVTVHPTSGIVSV